MSLEDLVSGKRVIVVGPAPSIIGSRQGAYIDEYDIVVRVNKAIPVPPKLYKDIGKRTDILYHCLNMHPENGGAIDPELLQKHNIRHVRCPLPAIHPFNRDISRAAKIFKGTIPLSVVRESIYRVWETNMQSRPNTGIATILDLLCLPIKELYITGFTFFKGGYYSEYRPLNEDQVLHRMKKSGHHNQEKQLAYMQKILLNDKRVRMDLALSDIISGRVPLNIVNKEKTKETKEIATLTKRDHA